MTKKEKIKEAYGSAFSEIKVIKDNGWSKGTRNILEKHKIIFDCIDIGEEENLYRPRVLAGIDDNNGWIKVTDKDFPFKKDNHFKYLICLDNKPWIELYTAQKVNNLYEKYKKSFNGRINITHIKPIEIPKPPIY